MIALEYYSRLKNIEKLLFYPFSIFLEKDENGLILSFYRTSEKSDEIVVKQWDLSRLSLNCIDYDFNISVENCLPYMTEYKIQNISEIKNNTEITKNYNLIKYKIDFYSIQNEKNVGYWNYINSFLNSKNFKSYVNYWLWNHFLKIFHKEIYNLLSVINKKITFEEQKLIIFEKYPASATYWDIWLKVLRPTQCLEFDDSIAPELLLKGLLEQFS